MTRIKLTGHRRSRIARMLNSRPPQSLRSPVQGKVSLHINFVRNSYFGSSLQLCFSKRNPNKLDKALQSADALVLDTDTDSGRCYGSQLKPSHRMRVDVHTRGYPATLRFAAARLPHASQPGTGIRFGSPEALDMSVLRCKGPGALYNAQQQLQSSLRLSYAG